MTTTGSEIGLRSTAASIVGFGGAAGLVAVLAALPLFWFGIEGLVQEWAKPEFRFKPLVPALAFVLFLNVLRTVDESESADRTAWLGVAGVVGSLLIALLGNFLTIDDFVFLAIILWCAGLVVTCFGLRGLLTFWAPLGSLCLMVPLPRFILAPIQGAVQTAAAELAMVLLALTGVPGRIEGQLLDFGGFQLRVVEAVAGIEGFLPLTLVFFFFATFYRGPLWTRLLPIVLAAPVVVLTASCRIVATGLAHSVGGEPAASRLLSLWSEWVFFAICVAVLLAVTLGARRLFDTRPGRQNQGLARGDLGRQVVRIATAPGRPPLLAAAGASVALCALFLLAPAPPSVAVEREPFRLFPPEIGAWTGSAAAIEPGVARVLNADDYVHIDYFHRDEAAPVNLWSAYYAEQRGDKGGIHSPQDCLPIDGWNILSFREAEVVLAGGEAVPINRAIIEKGSTRALVYYWFEGRGRRIANERLARILVKVDGLFKARTDGALVRYTTVLGANEPESAGDARLQRFLAETVGKLPRFIPS